MIRRQDGIVTRFNPERGFGFIHSEGEDFFVHATQLPGNCDKGRLNGCLVRFTPADTPKGRAAYAIEVIREREE